MVRARRASTSVNGRDIHSSIVAHRGTFGKTVRIDRPRVMDLLVRALKRRLVLVIAPAGYGKTIALDQATKVLQDPVLWFSAGHAEDSLADVLTTLSDQLPSLDSHEMSWDASTDALPTDVVQQFKVLVMKHLPDGAVLVIDGIDRSPIASDLLAFVQGFLDQPTLSLHIALASRQELALRVVDVARTQNLAILGKEQLTFTDGEMKDLLQEMWGEAPDDGVLNEIVRITEGWPQGVKAIALAFRGKPPSQSEIRDSELLQTFMPTDPESEIQLLDEMDRQLLIAVSFLPSFTPADADQLAGVQGAGRRLLTLCDRFHWLTAHDSERLAMNAAIRGEFLSSAQAEWLPDRLRSHRRNVALLLERRRELALSLTMFVDAQDEAGANRVLGKLGIQWFLKRDPSEFLTLARRLEAFSELAAEGRLAAALVADAEGDYVRSYRLCHDARRLDLDEMSHTAFSALQARASTPREGRDMRADAREKVVGVVEGSVINSYLAAEETRRGAFKEADGRLRRSLSRIDDRPSDYARNLAEVRRADLQTRMGRYQTALASLRMVPEEAARRTTWIAMRYHYLFAEVHGLRGDFREAISSAATALDMAAHFAFDLPRYYTLVLLADLAVWMGDLDQARRWFGEAESIGHATVQTENARQAFEVTRGRLAWAAGAIDEAREAFRQVRRVRSDDCFTRLWSVLSACHAHLRIEEVPHTASELDLTLSEAERIDALHILANALLLAAYRAMKEDNPRSTQQFLKRFWAIVNLHGYRFMPASDAEIVLWAERLRAECCPSGRTRAARLISPALPTLAAARGFAVSPSATRPPVKIDSFGPLTITIRSETRDDIWKSRLKAKRFLEILLSSDGQRITADEAAEYLWPTASPDRIRHSLHNEVSNLRKIFTALDVQGHIEVRYEHAFYRLYCSDDVQVTHLLFQSLVERARARRNDGDSAGANRLLREAVSYYTDEFLKDAQYERFADIPRQQLADLYGECLHLLASTPQINDEEAITWWQKAIEHDPFDEAAYRAAIDSALRLGQKSKAAKYLSMLEDRLVGELELTLPDWAEELAEKLAKRR